MADCEREYAEEEPEQEPTPGCNCWVKAQPVGFIFSVRFGAHNPRCPVFRPSLDPLDMMADARLRLEYDH